MVEVSSNRGLTLVEVLVVVAVGGMLIVALAVFTGRSFSVSREHLEQFVITEDGRRSIGRMSDVIRDAQLVDMDDDGRFLLSEEQRIQLADTGAIQVYSDIDNDEAAELVRYRLRGSDLYQEIIEPTGAGSYPAVGEETVIVRSLRNEEEGVPLFTYYREGSETPLSVPIDADLLPDVTSVGINPLVEVEELQYPPRADFYTLVSFRSTACQEEDCSDFQCQQVPGISFPSPKPVSSDFAEEFFEQCQDHCRQGNPELLDTGTCCPWSEFHIRTVKNSQEVYYGDCLCEPVSFPVAVSWAEIGPGTNYESYSDFQRQCDFQCAGESKEPEAWCRNVSCDAVQDYAGQCACLCV